MGNFSNVEFILGIINELFYRGKSKYFSLRDP